MVIQVNENIRLELIAENHAAAIFAMVDQNRDYLKEWLPFVEKMQTVESAQNFVRGTMQRNREGQEFAFVIMENEQPIGRIGVYKIDNQNKIGEIGYWIIESAQGQGIVTNACKAMMGFCFNILQMNRIEIKCGTENVKSRLIPERLHFTLEGIIRQGERLYDHYIDLFLYSLLKTDWNGSAH